MGVVRRSDRWSFIALGVGIAAILGGVQVAAILDEPPAAPRPTSEFCPDGPTGAARTDTGYRDEAEPYRGAGPHRVAVDWSSAPDGRAELPEQWNAGMAADGPKPRLVACVYQESVGTSGKVRDCLYTGHSLNVRADPEEATKVPLLKARYVVRLYEAKTAKPVGLLQVPGGPACPSTYTKGSGGSLFQEPDTKELRAALRPYVERTVNA
ncbi:hypothetical protein Acsp03_55830 [Actinomadura sp. NBRC 104412]|nr:hypothetical protein Acsp03_55830 [Actinomadura sp. NBRC 104412]